MNARTFSDDAARARITESIVIAEKRTNAEVVVALRRHASAYAATSVAVGASLALVALAYLWFSPTPYDVRFIPLEVLLVFAIGCFASHSFDALRFRLTRVAARSAALERASKYAFHVLGVSRTRARNGVLVYAAIFEREARVVVDEGIDWAALGESGAAIERKLSTAVERRDLDLFAATIVELGDVLASQFPPTEDDVNELCDAPV